MWGKIYSILGTSGYYSGPIDYVNPIPNVFRLRKEKLSLSAIEKALNTTGNKRVAIILVEFPSSGSATSGANTMTSEDKLYVYDAGKFLSEYYKRASYGKLNLEITYVWKNSTGSILTGSEVPYKAKSPTSTYGLPKSEGEHYGTFTLIKEVLNAFPNVNSTNYDFVVIVHAGVGEEITKNPADIWSVNYGFETAINGFFQCSLVPTRESKNYCI